MFDNVLGKLHLSRQAFRLGAALLLVGAGLLLYSGVAYGSEPEQQVCYSLNLNVNPSGSGTIIPSLRPNCNGTQYLPGSEVTLYASPNSGYTFDYWTGSLTGSSNPQTVVMFGNRSVTAHFDRQCYSLFLYNNPSAAGFVTFSPYPNCNNGTQYENGTQVLLTAQPGSGYAFSYWSGNASGSANPIFVTMNRDRYVTANYILQCYTLTLGVNPPGSGSVSASPPPNCNAGTQYTFGTSVSLQATPSAGYAFKAWTGDLVSAANPASIAINGNKNVTANFEYPAPTLTHISPEMVLTGGGDFTLSVFGTGFNPGSLVRWNGINLPTVYISSQRLDASVAAAYIASPTVASITVFTPAPGGGTSGALGLIISSDNPAPVLNASSPPALAVGSPAVTIRLLGRNFTSTSQATWNGNPLTVTFINSTVIQVEVPAAYLTSLGSGQVIVTNPAPGGGSSLPLQVQIANLYYLPLISKQ